MASNAPSTEAAQEPSLNGGEGGGESRLPMTPVDSIELVDTPNTVREEQGPVHLDTPRTSSEDAATEAADGSPIPNPKSNPKGSPKKQPKTRAKRTASKTSRAKPESAAETAAADNREKQS